ncbi:YgaP-like transmembrane domain [Saccharopolyspora sp. NPDC002376]
MTSTSGLVAIALGILLVLAGADLAVTGALGHCPLYRSLGYTPASLKHRTP